MPDATGFVPAEAWKKALTFHGHACPGLALGCRIAVDALAFFGAAPSVDEELVCVAETESCAIDALQAVTGCTLGKGNLLLRPRGKHAFSFFSRPENRAVRFLWTGISYEMPREERIRLSLTAPPEALYTLSEPAFPVPPKALVSPSLVCAACGERTSEACIRLHEGKHLCPDCHTPHCRVNL